MAKGKGKNSGATLIQKLSQPVSWKAIMDVMTHEITIGSKSPKTTHDFNNLDVEVERLLEQAELAAEKRGVPVEQVLQEMGLMKDAALSNDASADREELMQSLGWQDTNDATRLHEIPEKRKTPRRKLNLTDEVSLLREIKSLLPQLTLDDISLYLHRISIDAPHFTDKLLTCDVLSEEDLTKLKDLHEKDPNTPPWRIILSLGGDWQRLIQIMETEPWFPLIHTELGDFVEFLLENELITYRQFKEWTQERHNTTKPTLTILQQILGPEAELSVLMSNFFGIPTMEALEFPIFTSAVPSSMIPFFRVFDVVPLEIEPDRYILGLLRPPSSLVLEMSRPFAAPTSFRLLSQSEFDTRRQRIQPQIFASRNQATKRMQAKEFLELRERLANTSAVRLVEELFAKALEVRATDIHMEHQTSGFRVRFRVDSILQDAMFIHPELADEVTSRIKILAGMDITERRQPQDGHIKASISGQELNMRVATVPTYHGERIGIRLVNSGKHSLSLEQLGLDSRDMVILERLSSRPYGMILTTGPVGSGKTTTLYSSLARLDAVESNVITIEDPVEYELDNINQIEVNHKINFGFAEGLRAVLRQDPNIILLGEIRDHETAAIAIRASMTGLLVFSSLHTNDAVGAVTTFHNFNVPPLLIANSLLGVIAQRLVRRLCHCKNLYQPTEEEKEIFSHHGVELEENAQLARPVGCETCYFTGYQGRVGIFEVLEVTPEMRDLIMEKASEHRLRDLALANGMRLLSNDALRKVKSHTTSMAEAKRVVFL